MRDALSHMAERAASIGGPAAASAMATVADAQLKRKLTTYSRAPGTPTPSPAGDPPALVSGTLRRSITIDGPTMDVPGEWSVEVGPTAEYGRVQELGGGPRDLPARPYVAPTEQELRDTGVLEAAAVAAFRRAVYQ